MTNQDSKENRPLLVTRKQAAALLGDISIASIKRLEEFGVLHAKRLNPRSATAQVFFDCDEVAAVAACAVPARPRGFKRQG
jgi:hypothetical protein